MTGFDVTVSDVGADATATGIAEVMAPPDVSTDVTAETRNQYDVPLAKPITVNDVELGSESDDTTFSEAKLELVPYSIL